MDRRVCNFISTSGQRVEGRQSCQRSEARSPGARRDAAQVARNIRVASEECACAGGGEEKERCIGYMARPSREEATGSQALSAVVELTMGRTKHSVGHLKRAL